MSSFSVSPAVVVREIDLTGIIPAVSTTVGAFGGVFNWGPADTAQLVSNETQLVTQYGRPSDSTFETFYTAANFLSYSNSLYVSRAVSSNAYNAVAGDGPDLQIKNRNDYLVKESSIDANTIFVAKFPGELGNGLRISVCDSEEAFSQVLEVANTDTLTVSFTINSNQINLEVENLGGNSAAAEDTLDALLTNVSLGDLIEAGNTSIGSQFLKITDIGSVTTSGNSAFVTFTTSTRYALSTDHTENSLRRFWEFFTLVDSAPGTSLYAESRGGTGDELHVIIVDDTGAFTRNPGEILERFPNLSRASDARGPEGGSIFYRDVINQSSRYVWAANPRPGYTSVTGTTVTPISTKPYNEKFAGGTNGVGEIGISLGDLARAYDVYKKDDEIDISLLMTGKSRFGLFGEGLANYLTDNIAEYRKDCVVFASAPMNAVVNNPGNEVNDTVAWRRACRFSSYLFLDSGYKYQYDRYNDRFRWVPLNGDIAGLAARTDETRDPWFSFAGLNRGKIKNVFRLAWNPDKANRDLLYKNDINPVVTFTNQGTVLFGDKTALGKPSAFDRINVRRLFIILEKAIATASKFILFEFNDEFTRAQFRNLVEPYLRDIQGRRGIFEFRVDTSRNTPDVIDRNEFIGDIYIKPARSINVILLSFVAVPTGVEFNEVIGQF